MSSNMKRAATVATMVSALIASGVTMASNAAASTTTLGSKALGVAKKQIGDPYVWGAAGPNAYDCSGLTWYSFKKVGKKIPRVAQSQYNKSKHITKTSRKVGDLIFFGSNSRNIYHVGIYKGNNNMVAAPYPGKNVRTEFIGPGSWWAKHAKMYYGRYA